jgi:GNAT superfamily N-acetyltransferase
MGHVHILAKPDWISWEDIHNVLYSAHETNRRNGVDQFTAYLSGDEIERKVSLGQTFVALDGKKVVGTLSVVPRKKHDWFVEGNALYYMLLGILPEYQGTGIYSLLISARDDYAKAHNISTIYMHTSENNMRMQKVAMKEGFRLVSFSVSPKTDYYSVILAKWLNGCPFSSFYCKFRFLVNKYLCKMRYKPGKVKRFF